MGKYISKVDLNRNVNGNIMNKKELTERGKNLAFLLRHDKSYQFDHHGWRTVDDLIKNHGYTIDELDEIVSRDEKGRYEYNESHSCLRARQGHSVNVDVELQEVTPPDVLYHGTATRFLPSIMKEGIKPMTRLYVQLSKDKETAHNVGQRHGTPVILTVNAKQMADDGVKFYLSRNGVWMTKFVDVKYISCGTM